MKLVNAGAKLLQVTKKKRKKENCRAAETRIYYVLFQQFKATLNARNIVTLLRGGNHFPFQQVDVARVFLFLIVSCFFVCLLKLNRHLESM